MKLFILSSLLMVTNILIGQNFVNWTTQLSNEEDGDYIVIKANIEADWSIYSQHTDPDGPIPTSFEFELQDNFELVGNVIEVTEPKKEYSDLFEAKVVKFTKEAVFKQKLNIKASDGVINGKVRYMCCDKKRCLPPKTVPFSVKL